MKRGDIYLAELPTGQAYEQSGFRPVIVYQQDFLIQKASTVIVIPLTTN